MVVILFDLEGTVVQSVESDREAVIQSRIKTREKLLELGIPPIILKDETRSTLMRNKALEYVEEHFSEKEARQFHVEMNKFLKSYELYWANCSRIFPDTLPALRMIRKLGYKMGLVTNTSREAANHMLSMHGIKVFFDAIVTREDVKRLKPNPEGILLALTKLNEQNFFFVGDDTYDSQAAKSARGISIIVNRKPLKKLKFHTHYEVRSLKEIPTLVQSLTKYMHKQNN